MFEQIKPSETTISINKTDIIVVSTNGGLDRSPYIGMNKLKRSMCYMSRKRKRQLVTLSLLTCIINKIYFIVYGGKFMTTQNMLYNLCGGMA